MAISTSTSTPCLPPLALLATFLLMVLAGCNLSVDLEAHPYAGADSGIDAGDDAGPQDTDSTDTSPPPTKGPRPLMTEVMVQPSLHPDSGEKQGQYIEIQNLGDEPIHPTDLIIEVDETNDRIYVDEQLITSPEEQDVVDGLVDIGPGEFFVFVYEDDPFYGITDELEAGTFYEYGRYNHPVTLSTQDQSLHLIEIRQDFRFTTHHKIGWRDGWLVDLDELSESRKEIRTDIGLGLEADVEFDVDDDHGPQDPANWCYHVIRFGDGPLLGSPGRPSPQSCL